MPLRVGQLASAGEAIFPQDHNQQADIVPVIVASLITHRLHSLGLVDYRLWTAPRVP